MIVYILMGSDSNAHEGSDSVEYVFLNKETAFRVAKEWNENPAYGKWGIHNFTYYVESKEVIND